MASSCLCTFSRVSGSRDTSCNIRTLCVARGSIASGTKLLSTRPRSSVSPPLERCWKISSSKPGSERMPCSKQLPPSAPAARSCTNSSALPKPSSKPPSAKSRDSAQTTREDKSALAKAPCKFNVSCSSKRHAPATLASVGDVGVPEPQTPTLAVDGWGEGDPARELLPVGCRGEGAKESDDGALGNGAACLGVLAPCAASGRAARSSAVCNASVHCSRSSSLPA
mmetsp:Transcript_79811/g.200829  ORF Transcript_79811/g.200829 Transcript_79811/m.200829 type:complete len:225 (-) Transcript_79811:425-1099(-)